MTTIRIWSGREIRALREARRMSQRDFAAHLGISERMVAKWEAGGEKINPRPVNQSALDSSLAAAPPDVHERFAEVLDLARQAPAELGRTMITLAVRR
jgi:transcriptional regulator with XRE-family HTH domain